MAPPSRGQLRVELFDQRGCLAAEIGERWARWLGRAETDRACLAGMLGGPEHTTLFLLAAEWRGIKHVNEAVAARTGQVLVMQAPAPGAGLP
jgi:hypothetical protein